MFRKYLIFITFSISSSLAIFDFFLFKFYLTVAFYTHHILAFCVGSGLMYLSYILIKNKDINWNVNMFIFIIGLQMVVVHIVKLITENCI